MKKRKQCVENYERLTKNLLKESQTSEAIEKMLLKDIEQLLSCYFIYQKEELRYLFSDTSGVQEFTVNLKYRRIKDIKIL